MKFSILIPHWKTGKISAYSVAQLLKFKGKHEIDIVVVDNNSGDGSIEYLEPFMKEITIIDYPKDKCQSHGLAFDYILPLVQTEYFITIESDSFPTQDNWLDYYEKIIENGYDCAGSLLKLSAGEYLHPCGALYKKSVWQEAKDFVEKIPYAYFSNMSHIGTFDYHLMVHDDIFDDFVKNPDDYVELAQNYKPYTPLKAIDKLEYYSPVGKGVFHNGIGDRQEHLDTFHLRTIESEKETIFINEKHKLINRIGCEPGQYFSWWMAAMNKKMFFIPTETKWLPGRENQNQEYTIMCNGFKHLWGISAYRDGDPSDPVVREKQMMPEILYATLPDNQKM